MAGKADKVKARLPRGLVDRHPGDIRAVDEMMGKIRAVYELYGFEPVETPLIEYTDALGKFLPDQDRPNEGVFSFQDDDEQWLSLRYDLTAPLARFVAENFERLPKPYRSYRAGWVFRNEKPGPGRFRQFMQFDADTVGTPGVAADAEMCMMMADVMEALGLKGQYVVKVSNRQVLDGILEAVGLGGTRNAARRLTVLRALDKLDRIGREGVKQLLGKGRWDGSVEGQGDFTPGAGLREDQIEAIMRFLTQEIANFEVDDPADESAQLAREFDALVQVKESGADNDAYAIAYENELTLEFLNSGFQWNQSLWTGIKELREIATLVEAAGYGPARIRIDPSVVRGLEYYTGPVFEAELTFPVVNEEGQTVQFGSVGGGGRYDGLVSRFRGEPVPATGFSIGVSRLMTALKNLGKLEAAEAVAPVVVLVMDKDTESLGRYQRMVSELRQAGIRAEMYLGGAGMKAQMKYADRRGAPCVVIQGGDERQKGEVQIKDLVEGKRLSGEIESNVEWRQARPAQFSVSEGELVEAVRRVLEAQAKEREG